MMQRRPLLARLFFAFGLALILACAGHEEPLLPSGGDRDTIPEPPPGPQDTVPPSPVLNTRLDYSRVTNVAWATWSAPHDDQADEPVTRYEIRYTYTRGVFPPEFWDLSTRHPNPPTPAAPGSVETLPFPVARGRDLYVGIRSYDEEDNLSPRGNIVMLHIPGLALSGRCVDVTTGEPVEGLEVRISAGATYTVSTDAAGEFTQDELSPGATTVEIRDSRAAPVYHRMVHTFVAEVDTSQMYLLIPYQPVLAPLPDYASLLALFKFATITKNPPAILAKHHRSPVLCYIPPFVNADGVDYQAQGRAAAEQWMARTGKTIFEFVDSRPDSGVVLSFLPREQLSPLIAVTRYTTGDDLHPILDEVLIANDIADTTLVYKILLHELGHTIRLQHINDRSFIMYPGQPLPPDLNEDEKNLVILHQLLPKRVDMSLYDESWPSP